MRIIAWTMVRIYNIAATQIKMLTDLNALHQQLIKSDAQLHSLYHSLAQGTVLNNRNIAEIRLYYTLLIKHNILVNKVFILSMIHRAFMSLLQSIMT